MNPSLLVNRRAACREGLDCVRYVDTDAAVLPGANTRRWSRLVSAMLTRARPCVCRGRRALTMLLLCTLAAPVRLPHRASPENIPTAWPGLVSRLVWEPLTGALLPTHSPVPATLSCSPLDWRS